MRDVEAETAGLAAALQERQRRYERACEKLAGVRDISRTLAKCHMLLNEVSTTSERCARINTVYGVQAD
jgi:hypothetical protein